MNPCVIYHSSDTPDREILKDMGLRGAQYTELALYPKSPPERALDDPYRHVDLRELPIEELQAMFDNPVKPNVVLLVSVAQAHEIFANNKIETAETT